MSISVAPDAGDLAGDLRDRFVVVVTGAADAGTALAGLRAAQGRLRELGPAMVSPVVLSPDGPMLRIGGLQAEGRVAEEVPDIVAAALDEAGVATATVEVREPVGPLDQLDRTSRAAVLRCFPHPAGPDGTLPATWLEIAAEWVLGGVPSKEKIALRLLGAPFTVRAADAPAVLHAAAAARTWCDVVQGDLATRIRTASLTFGRAPHLALAAGGPGCDIPALLARYDLLCDVARELGTDAAYACVDLEIAFDQIGTGLPGTGWPSDGGADPNQVVGLAADLVVPDVYPFQILGPAHVQRLAGHRRRQRPTGRLLPDGRTEITLGEPGDWLAEFDTRDDAVEQGRKALQDLLVTDAELTELTGGRVPTSRGDGTVAERTQAGPDLADVTLEAAPHARRGLRLTILELAAWLGHEPHSDLPTGVSPVLAGHARWLAAGLDDHRRQELKPYAAQLVGTMPPGLRRGAWRPLPPLDEQRAWLAADWLARTQAPAWLRAAGLDAVATRLSKVRPRKGNQHLPQLLDRLSAALEQLALLDDAVDDDAWEAWERASETSGWVAASEAASVGIPDTLSSATDLRVREVARGGAGAATIVEDAREAAIASVAEAAWRGAGRSAGAVVEATADDPDTWDEVVSVSLPTALERASQGVAARLGMDRDAVENDLEAADAAAIDHLAAMVRAGRRPAAPLESARAAAAASVGGGAWTTLQELTHGVLGNAAWDAGLAAGRTAAARVLHHAVPLVDRAVVVALAREAGGLAARVTAARGGAAAVEPVVEELRPAAVELLDDLLAVR